MRLRYYTPDDYVNGIPCLYKYMDVIETVFPISMSGCMYLMEVEH